MHQLNKTKFREQLTPSRFLQLSLENDNLDTEIKTELCDYYRNWNNLRSPRLAFWYDNQLNEMLEALEKCPGARILDAGCGTGSESLFLALKGAHVTGIDVSPGKIKIANARQEHLRDSARVEFDLDFYQQSILDVEGTYDLIWLEQAFHHMEPRARIVQQLADLLAPGGRLFFSEANGWNPLLQVKLFKQRGFDTIKRTKTSEGELIWGDERILTPMSLKRCLKKAGLKLESRRYFRIFPSGERFDTLLNMERALCDLPIAGVLAPLFSHYSFVAKKSE